MTTYYVWQAYPDEVGMGTVEANDRMEAIRKACSDDEMDEDDFEASTERPDWWDEEGDEG